MKKFNQEMIQKLEKKIDKVYCNACGREIKMNKYGYFDDYLTVEKRWSYGSRFDNQVHSFDLCQDCYNILIESLQVKPDVENEIK